MGNSSCTWHEDVHIEYLRLPQDGDQIVKFLQTDFLFTEPLNAALRVSAEESRAYDEEAVNDSEPEVSFVAKTTTGTIAGVSLACTIHRGDMMDLLHANPESPKMAEIKRLTDAMDAKIWKLVPAKDTNLLYVMIVSVGKSFTRNGTAELLLSKQFAEAKRHGCQGVITEATAIASQNLFSKLDFEPLYELKYDEWKSTDGQKIFACPDGSEKAVLFFKKL